MQDIIEQLLDRNLLNLDLNDQKDVDDTSNKLADSNVREALKNNRLTRRSHEAKTLEKACFLTL